MGLNVITLEVLQNRLEVIADEMEAALLRASSSPIVKEELDASAALFTPGGGGGYGDPLERPTATVRADVLDRKVSAGCAREVYGVVLHGPTAVVDPAAAACAALAARRGPVDGLFDHGERGRSRAGVLSGLEPDRA
jgi:N-methylhydantoinase B/oxoprolinase/acetone carboxylase alpha subunit